MLEAAKNGKLKALYVAGSNPVYRLGVRSFHAFECFAVVQDMFLTGDCKLHRRRGVASGECVRENAGHFHEHM